MAAPAFIEAFRALQTSSARREALAALAHEFSPYEWRQVQALANAKSFQFDIVGALPTELVFHIFSYLDIATPFRLQTVSRRWCGLLRSADLYKPILRDWYDNTASFEDASYEDCLREAQTIHRVRTGKFLEVSATKPLCDLYPHDSGAESPSFERMFLMDDFLIDIPYPFRHLRVSNLCTGEGWRANADGREVISRVVASSQLIAFWTMGRQTCYIFDFTGARKGKFRLPPFMNKIATSRERTVVCGGITDGYIGLYLWDLDSNSGKTLRLDKSLFDYNWPHDHCVTIDIIPSPRSQTFTLFTTRTCEARWCGHHVQDLSIHYCNVTFDGRLLQQNTFIIPLPDGASDLAGASITRIQPVDRKGSFMVKVHCRYDSDGHTSSLHFNEDSQVVKMMEQLTRSEEYIKTACWKDSFYRAEEETLEWIAGRGESRMRISLMHLSTSESNNWKGPLFVDEADIESLVSGVYTRLLVNDRFAVMVALDRTYVFSFAAKAKTADSTESGSEDEQHGKFVLWKVHLRALES